MESGDMLALAKEVPADLLEVATADAAFTLLDAAVAELDTRVEWTRRLALGPLARTDFPDKPFDASARELLQAARREMHTLSSGHAAVGRAFAIARARVGATNHPDLVQAYEARRHDALLFAKDALDKLLSAAGYAEAAAEAFELARGVAYASPLWRGWADSAEGLAREAHNQASAALDALLGMRREVCLEFFAAWRIIKAVERDAWVKKARAVPMTLYKVATFTPAEPAQATPREKVAAAHVDLKHVLDLHDGAGADLRSSARHLGLPHGDLWQRWSTRHSEVAAAGKEALASLTSAANTIAEFMPALPGGKPPPSQPLLLRARQELRSARAGLTRMRTAATLEFFDAAWITHKPLAD